MAGINVNEVFKLGFGMMRLPHLEDGSNDMPQICEMVDRFMEAGGTYFDTAYVYDNGKSEEAVRRAVVERYPRERYTICTKMNAWLGGPTEEETKRQLAVSLERMNLKYVDFYLLHAIQPDNRRLYEEYGLWDFIRRKKEQGVLRHIGFSFHADPVMLDRLLTEHPEVDFVQLQINYADWQNPVVAARENYETARRHGVPITVMEPVKGGKLADPIDSVKRILTEADPASSFASWAIRYAASMEGILTVLSGMSTPEQMEDNLSYMRAFKPLSSAEQKVIRRVQTALIEDKSIPCTACRYCVDGCPRNIPIPDVFSVRNAQTHYTDSPRGDYDVVTRGKGKASDCIGCGQCESACPQRLPVIRFLKECAEAYKANRR